mgnify:CR=1 FL=1
MTTEVLTTIAAQQTADLQRVAKQLGADFVPYAKRIESGIFDILKPYEDKSITKKRQDKILKDIGVLTNLEYKEYNKYLDTQMKLVSDEEVTTGVMALDTAIISDVDINEPKKSDVTTAVIGTPIQQGDKSWTTYRGSQDAFKSSYVSEINSATLASMQGAVNGKEVADALYTQIHYTGRKASKSVLDRSRRSANSLSATLTNHTANVTRVQFGEANSKLVKGYVFIAVLDSQTSQTCRSADQTTMKASNPKFSAWSPPRHRNCRSALSYDVDERYRLDDDSTKRASSFTVDGLRDPKPVSSKGIYYDKMRSLGAADQDKIMGPTLGKAFRAGLKDGTMTPESFAKATVDSLFQPLTVKQMSERNNRLGEILRKQNKQ